MMLRTWLLLTLALALPAAPARAHLPPSASSDVIGARAVDTDGRAHLLGMDGLTEVGPVALVFIEPGCPIAKRYAPRLNEIAAETEGGPVEFYGVISDPTVSAEEARAFRSDFELAFPVLFDASGDLAQRLAPTHVPEAFVVSSTGRVVYRGRIDDRFEAVGRLRQNVSSHELLDAVRALGGGGGSIPAHAEPVGCVFEAWDGEPRPVTYNRDVAPILAANCVECHREGDIGPFPLASYEDARRRAKMISQVCGDGFMPPWFADLEAGRFRDERGLSPRQLEVLETWAAAGCPEGEPDELLPAPPLAEDRWRLGEPDLLIEMPLAYEVPAGGDDIYRYFVVPNEVLEERAIVAIDFRPGDPAVVHHCIAYLDRTGVARMNDELSEAPGFSVFGDDSVPAGVERFAPSGLDTASQVALWAPGTQPYRLPQGVGTLLEPGGDFVLEIHYHPTGKATTDRSALALYFADRPVERYTAGLVIGTQNISIPPGDGSYWRHVWMELPHDLRIVDVMPHMHYLGKRVDVVATLPDGLEEPLIQIDRWDFRWQGAYFYRRPVELPAGSRIDAYFEFDNSGQNPFNPSSPPIRVQEGWRTTDEMCLFFFTVIPDRAEHVDDLYEAMHASFGRSGAMD